MCVVCGKPEGERAHFCHHIDGDKQNCNLSNFVLLCHSCHSKVHSSNNFDAYRIAFEDLFVNISVVEEF